MALKTKQYMSISCGLLGYNARVAKFMWRIVTLLLVSSCTFMPSMRFWLRNVEITAEDNINKNRIIMCNIVACYTDDANNAFKDLKASEYFTTLKKKKLSTKMTLR